MKKADFLNYRRLSFFSFFLSVPLAQGIERSFDSSTVIADEYVRNYIGTALFMPETGAVGGVLRVPNSLTGGRVEQSFAAVSGTYEFEWADWGKIGFVQPFLQGRLGGMFYDSSVPLAGGDIFAGDASDGFSVSGMIAAGIHWRPWRHTTFSVFLEYGAMYLENNYTFNNPASAAMASRLNGSLCNWESFGFASTTRFEAMQSVPLWRGGWGEHEDDPQMPRLRLKTTFSMLSMVGLTEGDGQYISSYVWTNGVELFLPLAHWDDSEIFLIPFFARTDMFDDGNRSLAAEACFYEAGVHLGFADGTDKNGGTVFMLSGSAIWGDENSGWQASVSMKF